ncbi:hypothetical protein [Leptothoe spongobia]|uniref:hypothetical protein n=1 Tax=Leptothoe spongobia TaxID=2651728 RepID=UPI001C03476D|nr:hypothetical protein [Leptothoe spongobia]
MRSVSMASNSRKKEDFFFNTTGKNYAKLNLVKASFSGALLTAMGAVAELPADGTIIATGKEAALGVGISYLNIYYPGPTGKLQSAKVPIAPSKADTAIADLPGKTYRGKKIELARVPRRRCYTV